MSKEIWLQSMAIVIGPCWTNFCSQKLKRRQHWQHLVSTGRRYVAHSRSCTRCFAPYFWRSHYHYYFFFLPKSASFVSRSVVIFPSVVQAYTQPYSFGGRIKLIICQIRYELSVTIYEMWEKKALDGGVKKVWLWFVENGAQHDCSTLCIQPELKTATIHAEFLLMPRTSKASNSLDTHTYIHNWSL